MKEQRKNARFETLAKVKIKEIGKEDFPLKDLSATGCRIEFPISKDIMPNMHLVLKIIPEKAAGIDSFTISSESKWVSVGGRGCEAGFLFLESPTGKQFQHYVDYLSWRCSQGQNITEEEC